MKTRFVYLLMFFAVGIFFNATILPAQVFVDITASGANNGSSWANAYTDLSVALNNTASGEIWVANGTYRPINCNPCDVNDRLTSLVLPPTIQLYGGFAGNETQLDQRDWESNLSILSGDIGVANDSTDNSFRVLSIENSTSNTILDGFIVEEGNADGSSINGTFFSGGGIYLDASPSGTANIKIRNCTIRNNFAGGGGGMTIDCVIGGVCEALIEDCIFEGNTASTGNVSSTGGAILMLGNSGAVVRPSIIGCTFQDNFVGNDGAAISMTPSGTTSLLATRIERCTFNNNESTDRGGAIWYRMIQGASNVMIEDCQFTENVAGGQGGAVFARASFAAIGNDTLLNCIFSNNRSEGTSANNDGEGGAVFLRGSQTATRNHQVLNCVFDRNYASHRGGALGTTSFFDTPSDTIGTMNANLVNCSFYGNKSDGDGGAIHANGTQGTNTMSIANSIFWRDTAAVSGMELSQVNSEITVSFSNIDGGLPTGINDGGNNLNTNPFYNDPTTGDLRIGFCSPLINAGNNNALLNVQDPDPDGDTRIWDGTVDLGAYEVGIIYVDQDATGNNTGTSWANAFTDLQDGINRASGGDQIWVAQGTYRPVDCLPCSTDDRLTSLSIKSGTELYGGFNGTETSLGQRDWESNLTILSGDIGVQGDSTDNSFRVLVAENTTEKTVFDGFIVEEGNADGSSINGTLFSGGGLYINARFGGIGNLKIRNSTFRNNFAGGGGAVTIDAVIGGTIEAEFRNCIFEGNTASTGNVSSTGGAILMLGNSGAVIKPRIISCTFQNNFVGNDGGGISMTPSGATSVLATVIDSCTFVNNRSTDRGAGVWYRIIQGTSNVVIKNSTFENNTAGGQGGGLFARASFDAIANDTLINCIFVNNRSEGTSSNNDGEGGAVFLRGSQTATRNHQVLNCVFDQNYSSHRGGALGTTSFFDTPSDTIGIMNANLVNCTFYGNTTDGDGGAIHANGTQGTNTMDITNSIFWNDTPGLNGMELFQENSSITLSTSIIEGGTQANINDGGNNLDADPQFLDAPNGDLHISSCSPARDAGLNTALPRDLIDIDNDGNIIEQIDIDLDGQTRIFDDVVDMGAYEWNGTPELMTLGVDSDNVSCNGFCNGAISLSPSGGVPGYTISWSTGENTLAIAGLCPGNYAFTVTDAFSCTLTDSVIITENEALSLEVNPNAVLCIGDDLTLTAVASGGTGDYIYDWDNGLGTGPTHTVTPTASTNYVVTVTDNNDCTFSESIFVEVLEVLPQIEGQFSFCTGNTTILEVDQYESYLWSTQQTTQTIEINEAGIYSVTVTDANGCTGVDQVEVTENDNPTPEIAGQFSFCTGTSTVLEVDQYEFYSWSTGAETQTIEVNEAGVYSVTVTDANGCTGIDEVEVFENDNLTPQIEGQLSFCTGTFTVLEVDQYITYLWSTQQTTQTIEVNEAGIYSVTVTDANGCTGVDEVEVSENDNPTPEIAGQFSFCTGTSTILEVDQYESYLWSTQQTTQTIEVNEVGIYSVTVTDNNGCSGVDEVEVSENDNPTPEIAGQFSFCTGTSAILEVDQYESYLWSTQQTTQTIEINEAGIYSVTVTDNNGCTGVDEVEVTENDNPTPEIAGQFSFCTGTSTVLEVDQYEFYSWSTGAETQTIEVNEAGVYSVTVTDANGCTGVDQVEVTENDNLTPQIEGQLSFCTGTSTVLEVDQYETYLWSTQQTTQAIEINEAGIYSITVTDNNGCTGVDEVEVSENDNPTPEIAGQFSFCTGTSAILEVDQYETYLWSTQQTTQTIEVNEAGIYSITVTDNNGCTGVDEVEVSENDNPTPEIAGQFSFCTGTSAILEVDQYESYLWSTQQTTQTIEVNEAGIYSVTVTDNNGCTGVAEVEVSENDNLSPQIEGQLSFCTGASTVLEVDQYETYLWSTQQTTQTIEVNEAGVYSVTVTDANGCTGVAEVEVSENDNLSPQIEGQLSFCTGASTVLEVDQYETYLWSTQQTTQTIEVNEAGVYSVTVTDANGCTGVDEVEVFENDNLTPQIEGQLSFCTGASTVLEVDQYETYLWSTQQTTQTIEVNEAGVYSVTVTDANGCTGVDEVEVFENDNLTPQIEGQLSFCTGNSTVLEVDQHETYLWSTQQTTQTIEVNEAGIYSVTVTDNNGCTGVDEVEVSENDNPTPEIAGQFSFCTGTSAILEVDQYESYLWSTQQTTQTIEVNEAGIYSVTVTDANGCTGADEVEVSENDNPTPEIAGQFSFCTGTSAILEVDQYEFYLWSTQQTTQTIEVNEAGIYSVTVTDANGCTGIDEVEVFENDNLTPQIEGQLSFCTGASTTLEVDQYETYLWSTQQTTQTIEVNEAGVYSVTVTDANGCTGVDEVEVSENDNPAPQIEGQLSFCTGASTTLEVDQYETYLWSTQQTTQTIEVNEAGVYSVTVTDANGCTGIDEVEVFENDNLTPQIEGQLSFCTGASTVLEVDQYETYLWSTQQTTQTIEVNEAGVYSVTVTDANGCTGVDEVEVTENDNLSPQIEGQLSFCTGASTVLEVDQYETYLWSTQQTTQTIEVNEAGVYSVTVTDANGCTGVDEVEVFENDNLSPQIEGQLSFCTGTSTVLEVDQYENYLWSTQQTTQTIEVNEAGVYSVTVTDANGCTGVDEVEVSEGENLLPEITGQLSFCTGAFTMLNAGTYENYLWSTGAETASIEVNTEGVYSVTVTDSNGCSGSDEVEIIENENLSPEITGEFSFCSGSSTTLVVGTYETYFWSTEEETPTIEVSTGGIYSVTVSDGNGCSGVAEVEIMETEGVETEEEVELCYGDAYEGTTYFEDAVLINEETGSNGCDSNHIIHIIVFPEISMDLIVEDDCTAEGATVIANVFGGSENFTFGWSNGESGQIQSGVLEGNITVTVTNAIGCTLIDSVFVDPVETLTYDIEVQNVRCFGEEDGIINVSITGGLPPFQIEWEDGSTNESLENLPAGAYNVLLSDGNGCAVFITIPVNEPGLLTVEVSTTPPTTGNNGSAAAVVMGGNAPFTYQWSNGSNNPTIENLSPGVYSVTVTDVNGCIAETTFDLSTTTAIAANDLLRSFTLFPNPGEQFYAVIQLGEKKEIHLRVLNTLSQKVLDLGKHFGAELNVPFSMEKFASGNYFLIFQLEEQIMIKPFQVIH